MYANLFHQIDPSTTLLTVNNRLARYLQTEYALWQQKQGHQIFQTPRILPLNTWMADCVTSLGKGILLTPLQTQTLWQMCISDSPLSHDLLRIEDTAKEVEKAFELAVHWQLDLDTLATSDCPDIQAFSTWAQSFQAVCIENNWITPPHLAEVMTSTPLIPNQRFYLIGFDNPSPLLKHLFAYIKAKCQLEEVQLPAQNQSVVRTEFSDSDSELYRMAAWALELSQNTQSTIACIVPDLVSQRNLISRIFQNTFTDKESYNISAAIPLNQYPLVSAALNCFKLAFGEKCWQLYSMILKSPFIKGGISEMSARALLDHRLRNLGELGLSKETVLNFSNQCPIIDQQLRALPKYPTMNACSDWRSFFIHVLHAFGWPGDRTLDRDEFQTAQRLLSALDEFTQLRLFHQSIDPQQAYRLVNTVISKILFQPKGPSTRVHILGLLEAGGLSFDHAWIQGLNDKTLPAPLKPHPYLPVVLQREKLMPHANADHEWAYAQTIVQKLISSSQQVILSCARHEEDLELTPSPLIVSFPTKDLQPITIASLSNTPVEYLIDDSAPPVNPQEKLGGSYLFKAQALCPFKAFAEIRLRADTLHEPTQGLSAQDRGKLLHEILAEIWTELKSSDQLSQINTEWISGKINHVLQQFARYQPMTLTPFFIQLETRRLTRLINDWLAYEKTRSPFTVIECEQKQTVTFNGISLNLRTDRIDECSNGEKIIIDYKTGAVSVSDWEGDRPLEPQMLLYCVTYPHTQGIAFAQLKSSKIQFKGITSAEGLLPHVPQVSDWDTQVSHWNETLMALSNDFLRGNALVDPKQGLTTCQYCQLQTFCRIYQDSHDE